MHTLNVGPQKRITIVVNNAMTGTFAEPRRYSMIQLCCTELTSGALQLVYLVLIFDSMNRSIEANHSINGPISGYSFNS